MRLQIRLFISFLIATGITAAVASGVGIVMMKKSTLDEVQRKVQQDINTAKLVYRHSLERLEYQLQFIAVRSPVHEAITTGNLEVLEDLRALIRTGTVPSNGHMAVDMLTLVDTRGRVIYRAANPEAKGDIILWDSVVKRCLAERKPVSSAIVMPYEVIVAQNPALAERVKIPIVKTEKSVEISSRVLTDGMVLRSAYPIVGRDGSLLGALVAGILLNRDYSIVDTIKNTVYQAERYRGKDMGFSTLFLG
ncbi:MAG TPA: hypothetical protein PLW83_04305, partial [Deltaproteobacteria bacterium]|nr:hypothetical protein [Deltaproteobacteria bacterium]